MDSWQEVTLGDVAKGFNRYRPFILAVAAVLLVVLALPGPHREADTSAASNSFNANGTPKAPTSSDSGYAGPTDATDTTLGSGDPFAATTNGTSSDNTFSGGSDPTVAKAGAAFGPDCDTTTGRIRIPSHTAPPCAPVFSGSNGGATAPGVTAKEIKVVYYQPQADPATTAALTAAGANNSEADQEATVRDYVDLFNQHYQLYGRKVTITVKHGSGDTKDDAAGHADAVDIAERIKPFAVFNSGTTNAFPAELAARKILCICTVSQPQEFYEKLAPYVGYTPLMASTQGYIHRAEYVGKRLANRNATHAGDPLFQHQKRVFGLIYYETPDNAYRSGAQFFDKELKSKYGVTLKVIQSSPSDYAQVQEESRPIIQKFKDAGVTSVICACDPISPALLTQEATRQNYRPEWVITGSALTDTTLFARTYDPAQWSHAFGVSFLTARTPEKQSDPYALHVWHLGRPPAADNQYGTIYPTPLAFFTGVTMAGPNLTVGSWQKGLFSFPPANQGRIASEALSFGSHGIWPFNDFTGFDDVTEIWWDSTAQGPDELDNQGVGMYRYVDGGKRYLPGAHPRTDPKVFVNDGSVTVYDHNPDPAVPAYPHKHYYGS